MLSSENTRDAFDIRDNIMHARQFLVNLTFETFKTSRLHFYAATRAIEIISEASRRLPESLRERHAHLDWRSIRDAGNFYRHEYDHVAEHRVWQTVNQELEPLLDAVLREIETLDQ